MAFVLDASISAVWALKDESNPLAERLLANWEIRPVEREPAFVPEVWWFELRNVLVINERRKRISSADSDDFLRVLARFPIRLDDERDEAAIFRIARKYQLSFYDAAYLELAIRKRVPLATLDKALRGAAEAAGIALLG